MASHHRAVVALGLLAMFSSVTVFADTFSDMKTALGRMRGSAALHATWNVEEKNDTNGRFANYKTNYLASVDVTRDAAGLRISFSPLLLNQIAAEGRGNPDSVKNKGRNAMNNVSPVDIADSLNYADYLLGLLRRGTPVGESRVIFQQKPVRLLVLAMKEETEKEGFHIGEVKYLEDRMMLWIGEDNLPIAAERSQRISAGFLIFRGQSTRHQHWSFIRAGDSFVLGSYDDQTTFSGMGQHGNGLTRQTVSLH